MLEQVSNFEQEIKFITGFAGSGKSTKLASMAKKNTLVLVPTHKAAAVLMKKGVENVYTIHAVLGLVPTLNQNYNPHKNQRMQKLKRVGSTDLEDIADVFIDEFSMINQEILDLLLEVLPDTTVVTVFGDPYQLPPVDGEAIDPLIYTDNIEELVVQHRAEAPEVVETFMRFMNYLRTGKEMNLRFNPAIETRPNAGWCREFNPETDRILAYTNAKVSLLNNEIANYLKLPEEYSNGEKLVANGIDCVLSSDADEILFPCCISKGKVMLEPKLTKTVTETVKNIAKYRTAQHLEAYDTCMIEIDGTDYSIYYDANHYQTQKQLKAEVENRQAFIYSNHAIPEDMPLKDWCYQNRDEVGVKERGQAWSAYIAHSSLVFNLQRPFATTIHKSQGSEFSQVFIAQADIKRSIRNGYYDTYARLMYVALSRAIHKVIII